MLLREGARPRLPEGERALTLARRRGRPSQATRPASPSLPPPRQLRTRPSVLALVLAWWAVASELSSSRDHSSASPFVLKHPSLVALAPSATLAHTLRVPQSSSLRHIRRLHSVPSTKLLGRDCSRDRAASFSTADGWGRQFSPPWSVCSTRRRLGQQGRPGGALGWIGAARA